MTRENEDLISEILYLKNEFGISPTSVGKVANISKPNMSDYMNGKKKIGTIVNQRLSEALIKFEPLLDMKDED